MWYEASTFLPQSTYSNLPFKPCTSITSHTFNFSNIKFFWAVMADLCKGPWGCLRNPLSSPSLTAESNPKEILAVQYGRGRGHRLLWRHHRRAGYRETATGHWGRPAEWRCGLWWWVQSLGQRWVSCGLWSGLIRWATRDPLIPGPEFALSSGSLALVVSVATAPACSSTVGTIYGQNLLPCGSFATAETR